MQITDEYDVLYNGKTVGYYYVYSDKTVSFYTASGSPWDIEEELKELGLDQELTYQKPLKTLSGIIKKKYRVPGLKKIIYENGSLKLVRRSEETDERFSVYRLAAEEGEPDYSPLKHDARHWEGPHTPEDMREWATWYAFRKMDDGTYQAELDESWWWGGSHNDGGTMHAPIPEEWFELSYDEFLENVVTLVAAAHYGFTPELLKEREGLKEFFGFE